MWNVSDKLKPLIKKFTTNFGIKNLESLTITTGITLKVTTLRVSFLLCHKVKFLSQKHTRSNTIGLDIKSIVLRNNLKYSQMILVEPS